MIQVQTRAEIQTCIQIEIQLRHNFHFHLVTNPSSRVFVNKRIRPSFWPAQSNSALYHGSGVVQINIAPIQLVIDKNTKVMLPKTTCLPNVLHVVGYFASKLLLEVSRMFSGGARLGFFPEANTQKNRQIQKHCQRHNGPTVLNTLTHSTPLVQISRSFNKL